MSNHDALRDYIGDLRLTLAWLLDPRQSREVEPLLKKINEALAAKDAALDAALEALEIYQAKAEHRRTKEDEFKASDAITKIKAVR